MSNSFIPGSIIELKSWIPPHTLKKGVILSYSESNGIEIDLEISPEKYEKVVFDKFFTTCYNYYIYKHKSYPKDKLSVGRKIEFKYKNKEWKNGEIIHKTKNNIEIKFRKSLKKNHKIIKMNKTKIMIDYGCKTFVFSYTKFRNMKWLKLDEYVTIYEKDKIKYNMSDIRYYKVLHFRDGKSITFYKNKSLPNILTIYSKNITKIENNLIETNKYVISKSNGSIHMLKEYLFNAFNIPYDISQIILNLCICNGTIPLIFENGFNGYEMFDAQLLKCDILKYDRYKEVMIWPLCRNKSMLGIQFKVNESYIQTHGPIECIGVEIKCKFGKVNTYVNFNGFIGVLDRNYNKSNDTSKYFWENNKVIMLKSDTTDRLCRMGFYVSDLIPIIDYQTQVTEKTNVFNSIKWIRFNKHLRYYPGKVKKFYPFVRLLISNKCNDKSKLLNSIEAKTCNSISDTINYNIEASEIDELMDWINNE
eukprot:513669_1